jgi:antitoxin component YwqK of YwqJK toxin-antitoxin module
MNYTEEKFEFYDDEKIKEIYRIKNDKLYGLYESFHENGKRELITNFKNGLYHGIHEQYTDSGILLRKDYYTNNLLDKYSASYNYVTGVIIWHTIFL